MGFFSGVTKLFGGGGSSGSATSQNAATVNPVTNVNIDFDALGEALKTNAELETSTQKQIAAATLKQNAITQTLAANQVKEKSRQFNELMEFGKYVIGGILVLTAVYLFKRKKKRKGGKR